MEQIVTLAEQVRTTLLTVSAIVGVIGFLSVGMMYALSATPILGDWRKNNPQAFNDVIKGCVTIAFAASGGAAALFGLQ